MTDTHFTAWLTTTSSALAQDNIDIVVLEDENLGVSGDGEPNWTSAGGEALYTGVTNTPAEDGDHGQAQREAVELLAAAGWATSGSWDDVDTGYIITVERA